MPDDKAASEVKPTRSRLRRWVKRGLRLVVIAYLTGMLVLYLIQRILIFPGAYVHRGAAAMVHAAPGREMLGLRTPDGRKVTALFGSALSDDGAPRADAASRPTIVYFYGNGDCLATSMDQFDEFRRLGANVLIPEYVGYPMSRGRPSEEGLYATADAAYAYLLTRNDIDHNQIVIVGRSIGSGPAIDLASRKPVAGLATFSAFTSMDAMAHKVLPIFPTTYFLKCHLCNDQKIGSVKCPIFMAHGQADSLVPFSMMGKLAARAKAPVTTVPVAGADHNDIFLVGGQPLLRQFGEFLDQISSQHHPAHAGASP